MWFHLGPPPDPGVHNTSTILVLTRPRCSQHLHHLGPHQTQMFTSPPPSWSSPDPSAHNTCTILVLTRPRCSQHLHYLGPHQTRCSQHLHHLGPHQTRCSQHLHYLGPSAIMRQFQSLPHHSHITAPYHHPHHPCAQIAHILLHSHLTTHQLQGFQMYQLACLLHLYPKSPVLRQAPL